ncbi:hypothetical protein ACOSQ4_014257 [Xanthoceras sorbifolium]
MESEVARRRINKIAGHFVAPTNEDIISSTTYLLPMNCSGGLNSVIRRCDNRMYFARQSSASQACFMRPSSTEQSVSNASEEPLFSRPGMPPKCRDFTNSGSCYASEAPLFSRPARMEPEYPNLAIPQPLVQDCKLSTADHPKFAKPDGRIAKREQFCLKRKIYSAERNGIKGSPRMVVSEMGCNYVMTVEIPGVSVNDIRVEVDDQKLTVTAKRSPQCWKVESCSNGSISAYQKTKYTEEPYRVIWPLPNDVHKETVSAEFLDGLLQIIIPKI